MVKPLPCADGSFYHNTMVIPKPINTCRDYGVNIYDVNHAVYVDMLKRYAHFRNQVCV